jgi:hypothetical protein
MTHSDRAAAAARDILRIVADHIDQDIDLRLAIKRYLQSEFPDLAQTSEEPSDT